MKKIISMLCVIAMMFSVAAISASASGEKISLVVNEAETTDTQLAFDLVIECAEGIKASTVQVKYDNFLKNNDMTDDDFSAIKVSGATANKVVAQDFITSNYTDMSQSATSVTLCTIYVETANFKNDAAFYFTANSQINGAKSYATAGLEIAAPGGGEPAGLVATANKEAVTAEATYQIGTAVGMTATTPEGVAFTKMIWAIANGADRLYSKVVELPNVTGDFSVAATFVNGTHNANYADAEVVESIAISADDFDAIFTDGTNDYFTNAADATNKAE